MRKQRSGVTSVPAATAGGGKKGRGGRPLPETRARPAPGKYGANCAADAAGIEAGHACIADTGCERTAPLRAHAGGGGGVASGEGVAAADELHASGRAKALCKPRACAAAPEHETRETLALTMNGDTIPAWQRETHQQPLVGPRESLTALLRDFSGSELQYAKARTFLMRLRGQRQRQQDVSERTEECSSAHSIAGQDGCCKRESGGSSAVLDHSSTSTGSREKKNGTNVVAGESASSTHEVCPEWNLECTSDRGARTSQDFDCGRNGTTHDGGRKREASITTESGSEKKEAGTENEEDDVLREVPEGPCMRRVRRDGCCFYRGYMFGLLLYFLRHRDKIQDFIRKIKEEFRPEIRKVGYDMDTVADFSQGKKKYSEVLIEFGAFLSLREALLRVRIVAEMIDSLEQVEAASARDPTSEDVVEEIFNEVSSSNYIVVFARLLVSTHMKLNSELYLPFLTSYATVEEFCKHEVDPMWVAAEELQINALTAMTQVPVEIIYFDRSPGVNPSKAKNAKPQ